MTHFITASLDKTAKLIDADTLEVLKTYETERPLNSADISPILDHVRLLPCSLISCLTHSSTLTLGSPGLYSTFRLSLAAAKTPPR